MIGSSPRSRVKPVSVTRYHQTSFEADCDFVEGLIEERNTGRQPHGLIITAVGALFYLHRREWNVRALPVIRIHTTPSRIRVADLAVVPASRPLEGILKTPPMLCVEVLSPEDRFQKIVTRMQEYQQMGVPNLWIIDPQTREAWMLDSNGGAVPMLDDAFTIPGTPVRVAIADIFEEIDSAPKA